MASPEAKKTEKTARADSDRARARRADLVAATVSEIAETGSLDATVGGIARRAGISPALAFHYFGDKESLFLAAMRHVLTRYGADVRAGLSQAGGPKSRAEAIVRANFAGSSFGPDAVAAWLNFYVLARRSKRAQRLLTVYRRRLASNLIHALRPLSGPNAPAIAARLAGLIDGLYLRAALDEHLSAEEAIAHVLHVLHQDLRTHS